MSTGFVEGELVGGHRGNTKGIENVEKQIL